MYYIRLFLCVLILVFIPLEIESEDCENYEEDGSCAEACPQDMVKYIPPCDEAAMSQKTCRKPLARSMGVFCDYTRCDCPEPKVWDEAAKICVMIDDCSNQSSVIDEVEVHS